MDKASPKSADLFKSNLARLQQQGIGHMIDGKTVPWVTGQTFQPKSPIDGAVRIGEHHPRVLRTVPE
jgi:5-carboxymethyl-2-hydroxymuconic-semialdehyde dehydrogenase